jgi:hypothetical protein
VKETKMDVVRGSGAFLGELVRLVLAGLFVFVGLLVAGLAPVYLFGDRFPPYMWIVFIVLGPPYILLLGAAALFLFSSRLHAPHPFESAEAWRRRLEEHDMIVEECFRATRAFAVEELDDEGSTYFMELEDGRVLFLTGQYLYDYEPIEDDPEFNQPRSFPCTEFTVRRHREAGYVVELVCTGEPFEPELTVAPFWKEVFRKGGVPNDGEIIANRSYEELKKLHAERRV